MSETLTPDLCVIGAGSGGLSVAAGAVQMGASVVLVERGKMGGDCLNYGCVPSKALLAAGHAARHNGAAFGITTPEGQVDYQAVHDHVHDVIAGIAPHDSVERFEGLGVTVIQAEGRFVDGRTLEAGGQTIKPRRFVIATGSGPMVPPIPGLADVPYITNETLFDLTERPGHLIVIGGGPIGCELAQAQRHLGAEVTVLEMATIMPKDDPDLVDIVRQQLLADGVTLKEGAQVTGVSGGAGAITVTVKTEGGEEQITGTHLLVAAGRKPHIDALNLDAAGVAYSAKGIEVDKGLKTTNKRIYAIGDAAGGLQFTHVAGYHAGVIIKSALFRMPAKADHSAVPWVTYTDPELAQVGLTEADARAQFGDAIRILTWPYQENDRARAERQTDGLVKAIVTNKGKILGAGIAGPQAGELIQTWVLALSQGLKIGAIATMVAPYPTLGEVNKRAAGSFYTPSLFSERTKKVVRFLSKFG